MEDYWTLHRLDKIHNCKKCDFWRLRNPPIYNCKKVAKKQTHQTHQDAPLLVVRGLLIDFCVFVDFLQIIATEHTKTHTTGEVYIIYIPPCALVAEVEAARNYSDDKL
jgi:hypothetical protein